MISYVHVSNAGSRQAYRRLLEADGLWTALGPASAAAASSGDKAATRTESEVFGRIKGVYRPLMVRAQCSRMGLMRMRT